MRATPLLRRYFEALRPRTPIRFYFPVYIYLRRTPCWNLRSSFQLHMRASGECCPPRVAIVIECPDALMHILFLCTELGAHGGIQRLNRTLVQALLQLDARVDIIS